MHLIVHNRRDADPARLGDPFQPRGDVDPVAVNVTVFDDHITRVDADAKLDALVFGQSIVALRHLPLHRDSAGDPFDDARKLDQQPVAGGFDDAPLMLGDLRVDKIAAQCPQACQGAGLVPFSGNRQSTSRERP